MRALFFGLLLGLGLWCWGPGGYPPYDLGGLVPYLLLGVFIITPILWLE